jgi:hypothetical protein
MGPCSERVARDEAHAVVHDLVNPEIGGNARRWQAGLSKWRTPWRGSSVPPFAIPRLKLSRWMARAWWGTGPAGGGATFVPVRLRSGLERHADTVECSRPISGSGVSGAALLAEISKRERKS